MRISTELCLPSWCKNMVKSSPQITGPLTTLLSRRLRAQLFYDSWLVFRHGRLISIFFWMTEFLKHMTWVSETYDGEHFLAVLLSSPISLWALTLLITVLYVGRNRLPFPLSLLSLSPWQVCMVFKSGDTCSFKGFCGAGSKQTCVLLYFLLSCKHSWLFPRNLVPRFCETKSLVAQSCLEHHSGQLGYFQVSLSFSTYKAELEETCSEMRATNSPIYGCEHKRHSSTRLCVSFQSRSCAFS